MLLFETSTSVFELLWDIGIAYFVISLAFYYFGLCFITGCLITYGRVTLLMPLKLLTQPQAELISLPVWLLFVALWARYMIINYEIPRVGGFRLAIGILALVFMVLAELGSGLLMYSQGWSSWVWETDPLAAGFGTISLLLFGLMPRILMVVENAKGSDKTSHGHEKKPVTAALPTIARSEKLGQRVETKN